jgi:hypothetical protein
MSRSWNITNMLIILSVEPGVILSLAKGQTLPGTSSFGNVL